MGGPAKRAHGTGDAAALGLRPGRKADAAFPERITEKRGVYAPRSGAGLSAPHAGKRACADAASPDKRAGRPWMQAGAPAAPRPDRKRTAQPFTPCGSFFAPHSPCRRKTMARRKRATALMGQTQYRHRRCYRTRSAAFRRRPGWTGCCLPSSPRPGWRSRHRFPQ